MIHWPLCCHTGMPCCRHRIWHPTCHSIKTQGRYIDVELTQEAMTTHFNFFGLTRPKNALLSSHTWSKRSTPMLTWWLSWVTNQCPVTCESNSISARTNIILNFWPFNLNFQKFSTSLVNFIFAILNFKLVILNFQDIKYNFCWTYPASVQICP